MLRRSILFKYCIKPYLNFIDKIEEILSCMIGKIEAGLPGPLAGELVWLGGETNAPGGGVLRWFYHLKSRDADTSFKLDNNSDPLGVVLKDISSLTIIF